MAVKRTASIAIDPDENCDATLSRSQHPQLAGRDDSALIWNDLVPPFLRLDVERSRAPSLVFQGSAACRREKRNTM